MSLRTALTLWSYLLSPVKSNRWRNKKICPKVLNVCDITAMFQRLAREAKWFHSNEQTLDFYQEIHRIKCISNTANLSESDHLFAPAQSLGGPIRRGMWDISLLTFFGPKKRSSVSALLRVYITQTPLSDLELTPAGLASSSAVKRVDSISQPIALTNQKTDVRIDRLQKKGRFYLKVKTYTVKSRKPTSATKPGGGFRLTSASKYVYLTMLSHEYVLLCSCNYNKISSSL